VAHTNHVERPTALDNVGPTGGGSLAGRGGTPVSPLRIFHSRWREVERCVGISTRCVCVLRASRLAVVAVSGDAGRERGYEGAVPVVSTTTRNAPPSLVYVSRALSTSSVSIPSGLITVPPPATTSCTRRTRRSAPGPSSSRHDRTVYLCAHACSTLSNSS